MHHAVLAPRSVFVVVTRKSLEMCLRLHLFGGALDRAHVCTTGHRHVSIEDVNAGDYNVG
jgi:hypothetical protein